MLWYKVILLLERSSFDIETKESYGIMNNIYFLVFSETMPDKFLKTYFSAYTKRHLVLRYIF